MTRRWRSVSDPIDLSAPTATWARNARDRTSPQPCWLANSWAIGMPAISDGQIRMTSAAGSCPSAIRAFTSERAALGLPTEVLATLADMQRVLSACSLLSPGSSAAVPLLGGSVETYDHPGKQDKSGCSEFPAFAGPAVGN